MHSSVLQPVDRRRRRRRRRRRWPLLLLLLAVAAAVAIGAADGRLRDHALFRDRHAAARSASQHTHARAPAARTVPKALQLLSTVAPATYFFRPPLRATAAILVDANTGAVLYQRRPHQRLPIASTTKIMTAVLALERLPLSEKITIPWWVPRTAPIREGLRRGERVAVWKLLYGLMLFSANDDASALAAASAGSKARFVVLMNEKARRLGLGDTRFSTPSGLLDRGNDSTAWDLATLARYAMQNPRFRAIGRKRIVHVRWSAPTYEKVYVNKNQLLGSYRGADGIKTGWTTEAGHCLVASARRGGTRLIAVVLHSQDPYRDARRLLNFGFAQSS